MMKIKKFTLMATICLLLSGCTGPNIIKGISVAKSIGAEKAADMLLKRNEKQLCNWPTIGSLEREYGDNPTKYSEYHKFCNHRTER